MDNLYDVNGLLFWSEADIKLRHQFEQYFVQTIAENLKTQNRGFEVVQVEAPLLTPVSLINPNYTVADYFPVDNRKSKDDPFTLCLRPETTMGTYKAIHHLLNTYNERKYKLPLCVWQHGKSFRQEQDQVTKFMRLKEFYQIEFQIVYASSTANDYAVKLVPAVQEMIAKMIGPCKIENSDRLPDYSESTVDVVCIKSEMEVCSISKRKDFPDAKVLEVAIGTDRCLYNFRNKEV